MEIFSFFLFGPLLIYFSYPRRARDILSLQVTTATSFDSPVAVISKLESTNLIKNYTPLDISSSINSLEWFLLKKNLKNFPDFEKILTQNIFLQKYKIVSFFFPAVFLLYF